MMELKRAVVLLAVLACLAAAVRGQADCVRNVIMEDDFNSEHGGLGILNYVGFAHWTVSAGTVDLIGNGYFDFQPGYGLYVDLDGSSGNAGVMTWTKALDSGDYEFEFYLAGSHRRSRETTWLRIWDVDTATTIYAEKFEYLPNVPFTHNLRPFYLPAGANVAFSFANHGGDNVGMLLDNVKLTQTECPVDRCVAEEIFADSFASENGGVAASGWAGFANWNVQGTVDLVGNGVSDVFPGNDLYVCFGTETGDRELRSKSPINLAAGMYQLQYAVAGPVDAECDAALSVNVVGVPSAMDIHMRPQGSPLDVFVLDFFLPAERNVAIIFNGDGTADCGVYLDSIRLIRKKLHCDCPHAGECDESERTEFNPKVSGAYPLYDDKNTVPGHGLILHNLIIDGKQYSFSFQDDGAKATMKYFYDPVTGASAYIFGHVVGGLLINQGTVHDEPKMWCRLNMYYSGGHIDPATGNVLFTNDAGKGYLDCPSGKYNLWDRGSPTQFMLENKWGRVRGIGWLHHDGPGSDTQARDYLFVVGPACPHDFPTPPEIPPEPQCPEGPSEFDPRSCRIYELADDKATKPGHGMLLPNLHVIGNRYSYSFQDGPSRVGMKYCYDESSGLVDVHIHGQVWGGQLAVNDEWIGDLELCELHFWYVGGRINYQKHEVEFHIPPAAGVGEVVCPSGSFRLWARKNIHDNIFLIQYNHNGLAGWRAFGWIHHNGASDSQDRDFLFRILPTCPPEEPEEPPPMEPPECEHDGPLVPFSPEQCAEFPIHDDRKTLPGHALILYNLFVDGRIYSFSADHHGAYLVLRYCYNPDSGKAHLEIRGKVFGGHLNGETNKWIAAGMCEVYYRAIEGMVSDGWVRFMGPQTEGHGYIKCHGQHEVTLRGRRDSLDQIMHISNRRDGRWRVAAWVSHDGPGSDTQTRDWLFIIGERCPTPPPEPPPPEEPCDGADTDGDGIADVCDNCPFTFNPGQEPEGAEVGDACSCPDGSGIGFNFIEDYNVYMLYDFHGKWSDIGGKICVGRDLELLDYSIGSWLPDAPFGSQDVVVVGGRVNWLRGTVHQGNLRHQGFAGLQNVNINKGDLIAGVSVDFGAAELYLCAVNEYLCLAAANGVVEFEYGIVKLSGTDPTFNVFSLPADYVNAANTIQVVVPPDSTTIINIVGNVELTIGNLGIFGADPAKTLWNMCNGGLDITFDAIDIKGMVLAPKNRIFFNNGQHNGVMVGNELVGTETVKAAGEFHPVRFTGCICPINVCRPDLAPLSAAAGEGGNTKSGSDGSGDAGATAAGVAAAVAGVALVAVGVRKMRGRKTASAVHPVTREDAFAPVSAAAVAKGPAEEFSTRARTRSVSGKA